MPDPDADGDGDGFIEYETRSEGGVKNQGGKDSDTAIVDEGGHVVDNPLVTSERQAAGFASAAPLAPAGEGIKLLTPVLVIDGVMAGQYGEWTRPTTGARMPAERTTAASDFTVETIEHKKNRLELIIAILLGIVAIGIAYASFQAALYDSRMAAAYQSGTARSTEAESLYLEGNQQFVQDAELWNRLTQLAIEAESFDAATAADAQNTYDVLFFQAVSDDFAIAIDWADEQNAADAETYYSPLDNEEYQAALYGGYWDAKEQADAAVAAGHEYNDLSDRLMLFTVLMSVSLFLLGIAAVVRQYRVQLLLAISGTAIFAVSIVLTAFVPFIGL